MECKEELPGQGDGPQVNRRQFAQRIYVERSLTENTLRFFAYLSMLVSLMVSLGTFDAISMCSMVHQQLENMFNLETVSTIKTPAQMMEYMQEFTKVSYDMASALVDANTMDHIDWFRCFSPVVDDVCQLKYWRLPLQPSDPNFVSFRQLADDKLSPNNHPSIWDCPSDTIPNCIDRKAALHNGYSRPTFGLTPEDPIIFKNRMDYSYTSVTPLSPVVWQSRAKPVKCSGFGDVYNDNVLGAGQCTIDAPCDTGKVTSFNDNHPSKSGRIQTIFLTYEEPAFICLDRSKDELEFFDKSWGPWATHDDMVKTGIKLDFKEFMGTSKVFYKFISDAAYLQAPPPGLIYLNVNDPCAPACEGPLDENCSDPIINENHPMWKEKRSIGSDLSGCSWRKKFNDAFLTSPISSRANTFHTAQTTEINIATLVITPQMEGIPDIVTVVRVLFEVNQGGEMRGSRHLQSMSQTHPWWKWTAFATCFFVFVFLGLDMKKIIAMFVRREVNGTICLDILVCALTLLNMALTYFTDEAHLTPEKLLLNAFKKNSAATYFETFEEVAAQEQVHRDIKGLGFFLILIQFGRLNVFLALHPRLGILVEVMKKAANDMLHVILLLALLIAVLAFLGYWYFGPENPAYGNMQSALYTNFLMLVGEFDFPPPGEIEMGYMIYLLTYVWVIFIVMLNFILAVIVDSYEAVTDNLSETMNSSITSDIVELVKISIKLKLKRWPTPSIVWRQLLERGLVESEGTRLDQVIVNDGAPAVVAEEIFYNWASPKDPGRKLFSSLEDAREYLQFYVDVSQGKLEDESPSRRWPRRSYLGADPNDIEGVMIRKISNIGLPTAEELEGASQAVDKVRTSLLVADRSSHFDVVNVQPDTELDQIGTANKLELISPQQLVIDEVTKAMKVAKYQRAAAQEAEAAVAERSSTDDEAQWAAKVAAAREANQRSQDADLNLAEKVRELQVQQNADLEILIELRARVAQDVFEAKQAAFLLRNTDYWDNVSDEPVDTSI